MIYKGKKKDSMILIELFVFVKYTRLSGTIKNQGSAKECYNAIFLNHRWTVYVYIYTDIDER